VKIKLPRGLVTKLSLATCVIPLALLLGLAATPARADLFVNSSGSDQVPEFNATTGALENRLSGGGLLEPTFLAYSTAGPAGAPVPEPATLTTMLLFGVSLGVTGPDCRRRAGRSPCGLPHAP
jgi:hypothetical protein